MARYTLKTLYGDKQIERFEHRSKYKILDILNHPRHHRAGETGPWGESIRHPDKFEIFDSSNEKIFNGNIQECQSFVENLK